MASGFTLFGYEILRKKTEEEDAKKQPSFVNKENDDGALVVAPSGAFGTYVDLDGTIRSEAELITRYRDMSFNAEVDAAIDEIVNEAISVEEEDTVKIDLDEVNADDPVKEAVQKAFDRVLRLLNFNQNAYDIIRRWYIDGRLYYHMVIDVTDTKAGIKELRYVDPRKIRKIREVVKKRAQSNSVAVGGADGTMVEVRNEYYIYNEKGFNYSSGTSQPAVTATATGLRIANDSVAFVTSGLTDVNGTMVLSYLNKAIKPLNQLRAIEDSSVIYRLARAPERRVWYIDVGNLPRMKAEQYVRDIMVKHKNKLTYDAATGEYRDDRKFMTMLEDYWLPRREGGKGTEVETLPGGENLGEMEDVLYFQKKLYASLNVPINRLDSDSLFSLGRATEVTRDEVKFGKFIARLRNRFGQLFTKILEKEVVLTGIMSIEDWKKIAPEIKYDFAHDNYFMEMKDTEVAQSRAELMQSYEPYVGYYFSHDWVNRHIWRLKDEDVEEMKEKIEEEKSDPIYSQPLPGQQPDMMDPMAMGMGPDELGMGGPPGADGPPTGDQPGDESYNDDSQLTKAQDPQMPKTQQRRDPRMKKYPVGGKKK